MALTGIAAVKRYASSFVKKQDAEAAVKAAEAEMKELHDTVVEYFQRHGVDKQTLDGITVYLRRELWAGREEAADNAMACKALGDAGMGEMAEPRINTQKLSAYARELDKQGTSLTDAHPELKGLIKVSEVFKIGARQS